MFEATNYLSGKFGNAFGWLSLRPIVGLYDFSHRVWAPASFSNTNYELKKVHDIIILQKERLTGLTSPDPKRAAACREWHAWADQKGIGFATWSNEENRVRKTGEKPRCPKEKRFKEEGGWYFKLPHTFSKTLKHRQREFSIIFSVCGILCGILPPECSTGRGG